jgi:hypothetical protein
VSAPRANGDELVYKPTSGAATGWAGVALALVVVLAVLVEDRTLRGTRYALGGSLFGLLVWCYMLRPRLVIGSTLLELRNPFSSWHVPLAAVERVAVRAVTSVYTDDRRFDGLAVGRPVRSLMRGQTAARRSIGVPGLGGTRISEGAAASRLPQGRLDANMVANLVVEQILYAAERARATGQRATDARRSWAAVELGFLGLLAVAFVVSLLV